MGEFPRSRRTGRKIIPSLATKSSQLAARVRGQIAMLNRHASNISLIRTVLPYCVADTYDRSPKAETAFQLPHLHVPVPSRRSSSITILLYGTGLQVPQIHGNMNFRLAVRRDRVPLCRLNLCSLSLYIQLGAEFESVLLVRVAASTSTSPSRLGRHTEVCRRYHCW